MTARRRWTAAEDDALRARYADEQTAAIAADLRRTASSTYQRALGLGLRKSAAHLARNAGRLVRGAIGSEMHRFIPGHQPWNAGARGWDAGGRSHETRFKPGQLSGQAAEHWQPIGTERIDHEGYLMRKVADTGVRREDWRRVHVLVWEKARGPVPSGHAVVFSNRDRADIRLDNLELVTRAELMRRNSVHRYPSELKHAMRLAKKLRRAINKAEEASP